MGPFVEGFRAWLLESGYTPDTVRNMLKVTGQLGRWMASEGVEAPELTAEVLSAFLSARRAEGVHRLPSLRGFEPLLDYLRELGVVAATTTPASPVEELIAAYRVWLIEERGLAAITVLRYENLARRFLRERADARAARLVEGLTGGDVTAFLLRETARCSVGAAKGRVAELRSLLRFLYLKGFLPIPLAPSVPPVAGWHDTGVPRILTAVDVQRLLDSCDQRGASGIRDLAILTLVARLGLRSTEVARLELDDIDWRAGELVVRGKARRSDRLPLPHDVGQALSIYLCQARPPTAIRHVFLPLKAPLRPIPPALVGDVTRRACERVGIPGIGAHRLRHTLATELLRRGATLVEVSQVLRHRDLATTAIYAKVDLGSLRNVAQPWPGATR
jgi:site-specific recombinase XerD